MLKKLLITTAVSGLMLSSALAQSSMSPGSSSSSNANSSQSSGSATFISAQKPDQWLASKFKGTDVLGSDNQKVGDVSDILFDKDGKVDAYIVSVGGFLGVGSKEVALAPSAFQIIPGDNKSSDKLKISMNKDQLQQAANFEPYNSSRTTTGAASGSGSGSGSAMNPRNTDSAPAAR
jgi:sporulation protein YlmC with PRC-barrel domain